MKRYRGWHILSNTRWARLFVTTLFCCALFTSHAVYAVSQGDAQMIYGLDSIATPGTRLFSGGSWGSQSSLPTTSGTIHSIITRAAPNRNELLCGVQLSSGTIVIYKYDGATWAEQWRVTGGTPIYVPRFDIAYEQLSGRAMVLYGTNSSPSLAYRLWNGTSWTSATNYSSANANDTALRVSLLARSGTNEIAAAWVDNGPYLTANYWDGATSTWKGEPSSPLDTKAAYTGTTKMGSRVFDMAFESVSGKLMIMWGNDFVTYPYYVTRGAGPSGAWGTVTAGTNGTTPTNGFGTQGMDIQLAAEPGTNYIAMVNTADYVSSSCSANQCSAGAIWNGSSWGYFNAFDPSSSQLQAQLVRASVKWVQSGGQSRAVFVYDDAASPGVDWLFFNKNTLTWSAMQADFTGTPSAPSGDATQTAAAAMWLYNNPFDASMLLYMTVAWNLSTGVSDIYTKKLSFNGTTLSWSNIESSLLQSGLSNRGGWVASIAYYEYVPPVGSLTVDIVNASGVSVASPTVALSATSSGTSCVSPTATLGVSAQKIRVSNTTATAGWTATIAPTAGNTALWTAGTNYYDMNDTGGSGCTDSGDADSYGGRLSVNPSVGTITPQSGCTSTGVSKGSSAGFSQGATDTITLLSASVSAATNCYWDFTGISLQQSIPAFQASGSYSLPMTITVTAT